MEGLAALTGERPAAVRHLLARLWDPDGEVRSRAAEAVGTAAVQHPELGIELLRRFAWALNDESATNGIFAIPAMAAVAVRSPEMAAPFVGQLVAALEDPGLAEEARRALELIARNAPALLDPYRDELEAAGVVERAGTDHPARRRTETGGEPWNAGGNRRNGSSTGSAGWRRVRTRRRLTTTWAWPTPPWER